MRVASRIVGAVLVLCGLVTLTLFYALLREHWDLRTAGWLPGGVGFVLILAGWYYLRLDPDAAEKPQSASSFTHFLVGHRPELKILAQTGAVVSLIYFSAACLGTSWPRRWFLLPLGIGAAVLQCIARKIADPAASQSLGWGRVPAWIRAVLEPTRKIGDAAMLALLLLICWNQWSGHSLVGDELYHRGAQIVGGGYIALLYTIEALFFEYGKARSADDEE